MNITVGVAQFSPEVLNLQGCIRKATDILGRAKKERVQLLAFPETWIPVYPVWADMGTFSQWNNESSKKLFARLYHNSLEVGSEEFRKLLGAVRKSGIHVVLGVNERSGRSLFNSLLSINGDGELVGHHRKLVPTFGERLVWSYGDGAGLHVEKTSMGAIGGLICWEHWMPPARQALHEQGETIHVAAWPHGKEHHQIASRHYAFEGRCFVLAAAMYLEKGMFPKDYELSDELSTVYDDVLLNGGSSVIAPDGSYVEGPLFGKEQLLVAEIDPEAAIGESLTLDVSGHYSRPDVFEMKVNRQRKNKD